MMRQFLLVLLLTPAALAQPAPRPDSTRNLDGPLTTGAPLPEAVQALVWADHLAAYGLRTQSPEVLVAAIRLLLDHQRGPLDAAPTVEGPTVEGPDSLRLAEPDVQPAPPFDALALLNEAEAMSADRPALRPLLAALRQEAEVGARGRLQGALAGRFRVPSLGSSTHYIAFRARRTATLALTGDGQSDLDCYLHDEDGHLLATITDATDDCAFAWKPAWTGPFRLVVRNLGGVYNGYLLVTN